MNVFKWLILKNIIVVICFTILAIMFNKWWIIFFSLLFITYFDGNIDNKGE